MTAFDHWAAMHAWWVARRTERETIGKPWPPKAAQQIEPEMEPASTGLESKPSTATPTTADAAPSPAPRPARKRTLPPARPKPPDEGGTVTAADIEALERHYHALPDNAKTWTGNLIKAGRNRFDWRIRGNPTARRYELYRGVILLAEAELCDNDIVSSIVANITDTYHPDTPPGEALGQLDASQAATFAVVAHDLIQDRYRIIHEPDGPPRLEHVA